ncbi:MAG: hypothetical protein RDV00_05550 [Clostridia bacterium]|jgi:hypothetical protein|nr:hypothetical protein [Clostridia bacterium]MDQ7791569.1 hypothetical protein [Clostridia bacterium]
MLPRFKGDGLRNLFNEFMVEELKIHDNLIKYGKLKGLSGVRRLYSGHWDSTRRG